MLKEQNASLKYDHLLILCSISSVAKKLQNYKFSVKCGTYKCYKLEIRGATRPDF